MKKLALLALLLVAPLCMAQYSGRPETEFRPRFVSMEVNSNQGECIIRIQVDDEVEISMIREVVRVRTLRGRAGYDVGSECTNPLPTRGVTDFDFRVTDGRGRVALLRRPDQGDSRVSFRVSDPSGGDDKYTFEFRWISSGQGGQESWGQWRNWGGGPGVQNNPNIYRDPRDSRDPEVYQDNRGINRGDRGIYNSQPNSVTVNQAVETCVAGVRERLNAEYGVTDFAVTNARGDDGPGRRDWVVGNGVARTGGAGRRARFDFGCRVDFSSGQVRTLNVRPR